MPFSDPDEGQTIALCKAAGVLPDEMVRGPDGKFLVSASGARKLTATAPDSYRAAQVNELVTKTMRSNIKLVAPTGAEATRAAPPGENVSAPTTGTTDDDERALRATAVLYLRGDCSLETRTIADERVIIITANEWSAVPAFIVKRDGDGLSLGDLRCPDDPEHARAIGVGMSMADLELHLMHVVGLKLPAKLGHERPWADD